MGFRLGPNQLGSSGSNVWAADSRGRVTALPPLATGLLLLLPAGIFRSSHFEWRGNSFPLRTPRGLRQLEKRFHSRGQFSWVRRAARFRRCAGMATLDQTSCGAKRIEMNTCAKKGGGIPHWIFRWLLSLRSRFRGNVVLAGTITRSVEWRPPRTGQAKR